MRALSIIFAVIAFFVGLHAAFLWRKSSKVELVPLSEKLGRPEPVDALAAQTNWLVGILQAYKESAELNTKASVWTAWAVVFATISSLISTITS